MPLRWPPMRASSSRRHHAAASLGSSARRCLPPLPSASSARPPAFLNPTIVRLSGGPNIVSTTEPPPGRRKCPRPQFNLILFGFHCRCHGRAVTPLPYPAHRPSLAAARRCSRAPLDPDSPPVNSSPVPTPVPKPKPKEEPEPEPEPELEEEPP
ncbi:hypothetical protein NL676_033584 [Syzygium grande]|nr:hypothetical protein NL676_033584 [Syzygium grande]